jgi:large subunit ribosomal protein L3
MQYWPRKRAKKQQARVRSWPDSTTDGLLGFAAYKVGMTHVMGVNNRKKSTNEGEEIPYPVTILEAPPMRIVTARFYQQQGSNQRVATEVFLGDHNDLDRKLDVPDTAGDLPDDVSDYDNITVTVHTQPGKTGMGKKVPDIYEVHLGGAVEDQLAWIEEHVGTDIPVSDVFAPGDLADTHGITKGKGTQGPVKRFGIGLKPHKSEKGRRRPGTLGGWSGQQHFMYRVPQAGQHGYHLRTQYNNQIFKISDDVDEINVDGGYKHYGNVKSTYIMVKGSVQGPSKRPLLLTAPIRAPDEEDPLPDITYISTTSKQGR